MKRRRALLLIIIVDHVVHLLERLVEVALGLGHDARDERSLFAAHGRRAGRRGGGGGATTAAAVPERSPKNVGGPGGRWA